MLRIGQGYDLHRLAPGETLVLGGVELQSDLGTVAHSDGDVLLHALCDALLGAVALGIVGPVAKSIVTPRVTANWAWLVRLQAFPTLHVDGHLVGIGLVLRDYLDSGRSSDSQTHHRLYTRPAPRPVEIRRPHRL